MKMFTLSAVAIMVAGVVFKAVSAAAYVITILPAPTFDANGIYDGGHVFGEFGLLGSYRVQVRTTPGRDTIQTRGSYTSEQAVGGFFPTGIDFIFGSYNPINPNSFIFTSFSDGDRALEIFPIARQTANEDLVVITEVQCQSANGCEIDENGNFVDAVTMTPLSSIRSAETYIRFSAPEPGAIALLGLGIAGLIATRRRAG